MHLVQILLPLYDNDGRPYPRRLFDHVRDELATRFGGATAYLSAPAEGAWRPDGGEQAMPASADGESAAPSRIARDDMVTIEVMVEHLDPVWWADRRGRLEREMHQQEIVVRALRMQRL